MAFRIHRFSGYGLFLKTPGDGLHPHQKKSEIQQEAPETQVLMKM